MTRDEAKAVLEQAGRGSDEAFPLLDCAIACAIHDYPFRDADCVRILADHAAQRLKERAANESPDEALTEALAGDLRLNGDLLSHDHPANTDVIDVAQRRRGLSAVLVLFYLDAARRGEPGWRRRRWTSPATSCCGWKRLKGRLRWTRSARDGWSCRPN